MKRQINLAKDQIELAGRQIQQQDKLIETALEDLRITVRQAQLADAERAKVPSLRASLASTASEEADDEGRKLVFFQVYVVNYGKAPANNIELKVQFPSDSVFQSEAELVQYLSTSSRADSIKSYIELSPMVDTFGNRWATVYNRDLELLPWQDAPPVGLGWFYVRPGRIQVLWHAKCRQGDFPEGTLDDVLEVDI